jgi:hypothetical protein
MLAIYLRSKWTQHMTLHNTKTAYSGAPDTTSRANLATTLEALGLETMRLDQV